MSEEPTFTYTTFVDAVLLPDEKAVAAFKSLLSQNLAASVDALLDDIARDMVRTGSSTVVYANCPSCAANCHFPAGHTGAHAYEYTRYEGGGHG